MDQFIQAVARIHQIGWKLGDLIHITDDQSRVFFIQSHTQQNLSFGLFPLFVRWINDNSGNFLSIGMLWVRASDYLSTRDKMVRHRRKWNLYFLYFLYLSLPFAHIFRLRVFDLGLTPPRTGLTDTFHPHSRLFNYHWPQIKDASPSRNVYSLPISRYTEHLLQHSID